MNSGQPELERIRLDTVQAAKELLETAGERLPAGSLVVVGCSTSEVAGQRIGTSGSREIAEAVYEGLEPLRSAGMHVAYQCCEHLNRAVALEREVAGRLGLTEVTAVPVPKAGGSMAAYAWRQLKQPCLVEGVQARAGIDIGDTLIGMQLRPVAVPVRPTVRAIGGAHVNMAITRPKLIGGERAVYRLDEEEEERMKR